MENNKTNVPARNHAEKRVILREFLEWDDFWHFEIVDSTFRLGTTGKVTLLTLQQLSKVLVTDEISVLACDDFQIYVAIKTKDIDQYVLQQLKDIIES